jgi:hypothetical protein
MSGNKKWREQGLREIWLGIKQDVTYKKAINYTNAVYVTALKNTPTE